MLILQSKVINSYLIQNNFSMKLIRHHLLDLSQVFFLVLVVHYTIGIYALKIQ